MKIAPDFRNLRKDLKKKVMATFSYTYGKVVKKIFFFFFL